MKIKNFSKYLAIFLSVTLILQTFVSVVYATEKKTQPQKIISFNQLEKDQELSKIKEVMEPMGGDNGASMSKLYNLVVFVRFKGEPEYINDKISGAGDITPLCLIDNTYNNSMYSLKKYYQAISNQKANIETVYLSASDKDFSSFELANQRGYYAPKSKINPDGYEGSGEWRRNSLVIDWTTKVQDAINSGIKPCTVERQTINFADLDSNGDGRIDSITVILPTPDPKYAADVNSPLWAYKWNTSRISVHTDKGNLISDKYNQTSLQNNIKAIYKEPNGNSYFMNPGTAIHEMGHVFGLQDLYTQNGNAYPVYFMSPMAKYFSPIVQFMTARERQAAGWLDDENITPITQAGTYTLQPMRDSKQNGTMAYTLELSGNKKLYLEYRYSDDKMVNRFDCNPEKREKIYNAVGNEVKMAGLRKSGLLAYVVDMRSKFPSNYYGSNQLEVIGLNYNTKTDAPRTVGETISCGGYTIDVTALTDDKISFTVSGDGFASNTKPIVTDVVITSPTGTGFAKGSVNQFTAEVKGRNLTDKSVKWSISGGNFKSGTVIDEKSGVLKIAADEPENTDIRVTATSNTNTSKYDSKLIRVKKDSVVNPVPIPLTGTVVIDGTMEYGKTLSCTVNSRNSTQLSYQWKRGDANIGIGTTYTLKADDIGHIISCEVSANDRSGKISGSTTSKIGQALAHIGIYVYQNETQQGNQVTLTATVTGVNGEKPNGTITFKEGQTFISKALDLVDGKATYLWVAPSAGKHSITAEFISIPAGTGKNYRNSTLTETFDVGKKEQSKFNLSAIGNKTYGDSSFMLTATGGSGSGAITFTSSDPTVISISGTKATIHKAGSTTITATKTADSVYGEISSSTKVEVSKKTVTIKADDKLNVKKGTSLPTFTYKADGLVNGDSFVVHPVMSTNAKDTNALGEHVISIQGGTLNNLENYNINYVYGKLVIVEGDESSSNGGNNRNSGSKKGSGGGGGGSSTAPKKQTVNQSTGEKSTATTKLIVELKPWVYKGIVARAQVSAVIKRTVQNADILWKIPMQYTYSIFELTRINDKIIFSIFYPENVLKVSEK